MSLRVVVLAMGLLIAALTAAGCSPSRGTAVPRELTTSAVVPGMPDCRIWADDTDIEPVRHMMLDSIERERAYLEKSGRGDHLPPASFLAISGVGLMARTARV